MNVIFGAAGFAKEVLFLIERINKSECIDRRIDFFVAADHDQAIGRFIKSIPVIAASEFFERYGNKNVNCFVAVGSPELKQKIVSELRQKICPAFPVLIDPSVCFDKSEGAVKMGEGVFICARAVLTTDITIHPFVHVNLGCTIGHDAIIGSFSTLSPGVHISGNVNIDDVVFIGTGAVVLEQITIATKAIVGAGSVVTKNLTDPVVYIGMPAQKKNP